MFWISCTCMSFTIAPSTSSNESFLIASPHFFPFLPLSFLFVFSLVVRSFLLTYGVAYFLTLPWSLSPFENWPGSGTLFASVFSHSGTLVSLPPISTPPTFAPDRSFFSFSHRPRAPTLARSFTIMRDNARLHTLSFSALSGYCHARLHSSMP